MDKEKIAFLLEKYDVVYDSEYGAWRRLVGGYQHKYDLGVITEYITGDNVLNKGHNFVDYNDADINEKICICGCNRCHTLSKLYHEYSDNVFLVGSSCIKKAGGQEDYENIKRCVKVNGLCGECKAPLILRGINKNKTTKHNSRIWLISQYIPETDKLCNNCCDTAQKIIIERRIERDAIMRKKAEEELKKIREEREAKMRKEREEKEEWEAERLKKIKEWEAERLKKIRKEREEEERLEKIRKDPKNKHLLNISYADKDKYKLEFKTRWDADIKKWYWIGLIADMPEILKSKLIK